MSAHHIMRCRLAYSDEKHSREYKQHSYQFREGDNIKPKPYTYAGSHNRLNIIVHAYERRTQIFLPDHHAYIRQECGKEHNITNTKHLTRGESIPGSRHHSPYRNRKNRNRRKSKHPLHERHHRILLDKVPVESQIKRVTDLSCEDKEIAESRIITLGTGLRSTKHQYQRASGPKHY